MPEPILMEKFHKAKKPYSGLPDDWIVEAFGDELLECKDLALTHVHIMKLRKALREQPETLLRVIQDSIVPFIQTLPDIDWSIAGAEVVPVGMVCSGCLTNREKARIHKGDRITRDEADEQDWVCVRCGKQL